MSESLISGYVGYGKKQKYSNLIYLYLQVIFYTVITTAVFAVFKPEMVGIKTIVKAIVPFAYNTYWYFTAYFCLLFFMPFLNLMVETFSKAIMKKMLLIMFIVFSLLPTVFNSDFVRTTNGYSFLWLSIMYIVGAYIRKYGVSISYKNRINLLAYFSCVILTWILKLGIEQASTPQDADKQLYFEPD